MVSYQLLDILEANCIFKRCQSGFCQWHNTETALLRVLNDILMHASEVSILELLDLRTAFDTIDYDILINTVGLGSWLAYQGLLIIGFSSYLSDRKYSVFVGEKISCSFMWRCLKAPFLAIFYFPFTYLPCLWLI